MRNTCSAIVTPRAAQTVRHSRPSPGAHRLLADRAASYPKAAVALDLIQTAAWAASDTTRLLTAACCQTDRTSACCRMRRSLCNRGRAGAGTPLARGARAQRIDLAHQIAISRATSGGPHSPALAA